MTDTEQTKAQVLAEAAALRRRVAELEAVDAECQRAQTALQVSESRYRRLFETAQDGILILDAETGYITAVNPFLVQMLGYSHAEFLGKRLWEIGPFKDIDATQAAFIQLRIDGYIRYEDLPLETRAGGRMNVEFVSNVYLVGQQHVIQCNIRDITARKQAEEALSHAMAELQKRNEELDAFAQTVAHDLKGPAALIVGHAELLTGHDATLIADERQQSLKTIKRAGYKLSTIINELLLLAKLHKSEVPTVPLDMARIVAESISRLDENIKATRAEIIWRDASTWPVALGYSAWVEEVWVNYLSNALKYDGTPLATPRIELGADLQPDGMVCYWMQGNGPSLTPEEQARLFTPFARLDQIRASGHGLGLSIVRQIVEKLGGQVGLKSQAGKGSMFYFTLPAASQLAGKQL